MHTNIQSIAHTMAMGSIIGDVELFECEGGLFGKHTVQLTLRQNAPPPESRPWRDFQIEHVADRQFLRSPNLEQHFPAEGLKVELVCNFFRVLQQL